jgi:hypothetical protein
MPDVYGLRVRDASGNQLLGATDKITRFRYSNLVSAGVSGNTTLSDIDGLSSVEFGIVVNADGVGSVPHSVTRSGTTLSWSPNSGTHYSSDDTLVFQFLYT